MKNHNVWFSNISSFYKTMSIVYQKFKAQITDINFSINIIIGVQNSYESFSITQGCMLI